MEDNKKNKDCVMAFDKIIDVISERKAHVIHSKEIELVKVEAYFAGFLDGLDTLKEDLLKNLERPVAIDETELKNQKEDNKIK